MNPNSITMSQIPFKSRYLSNRLEMKWIIENSKMVANGKTKISKQHEFDSQ